MFIYNQIHQTSFREKKSTRQFADGYVSVWFVWLINLIWYTGCMHGDQLYLQIDYLLIFWQLRKESLLEIMCI